MKVKNLRKIVSYHIGIFKLEELQNKTAERFSLTIHSFQAVRGDSLEVSLFTAERLSSVGLRLLTTCV